jgi:serine/threonine protein kinase HipA of HipAB toxin-antitoxin module
VTTSISDGRHSYADLAAALRRFGADPRKDLIELHRRMVFNILVTNDDDHLRNHGFLHAPKGWRLSPLYDVVPKPQVGSERTLVLGVGPHGRAAILDNAIAVPGWDSPRTTRAPCDRRCWTRRMAPGRHSALPGATGLGNASAWTLLYQPRSAARWSGPHGLSDLGRPCYGS